VRALPAAFGLAIASAGLGVGVFLATAIARPLPTGQAHRLGRGREETVRVYWANTTSDETATVQPQPGSATRGDRYDLVDQAGYLGRAVVEEVDEVKCGDASYQRAQLRITTGRLTRQTVGQVVALKPTLGSPGAARVLEGGPGFAGFPAARGATIQLVDVDGDRAADLARQHNYTCRDLSTTEAVWTSCFETWVRELGTWRLVDRAELPPCR